MLKLPGFLGISQDVRIKSPTFIFLVANIYRLIFPCPTVYIILKLKNFNYTILLIKTYLVQ